MAPGQKVGAKKSVARKFSWELVNPKLVRSLLVAAYSARNQGQEVERVLLLQDTLLPRQAARTLGSPPAVAQRLLLAQVLQQEWLPTLTRDRLEEVASIVQLGLRGRDRHSPLSTKADMLAFLGRRQITDTVAVVLRNAFIAAHKATVEREAATGHEVGIGDEDGSTSPTASRSRERIVLHGRGQLDRRTPYAHQREAWRKLDGMVHATRAEERAGLLVLPTGAGKTYTMVAWLTSQLAADPDLRVLWLADQQELVDQAARAFLDHAAVMPGGTRRALRVVHGRGASASALADPELDIVCATRQSVTGPGFAGPAQKRLATFLSRPCVVVVDEAHHAVSPTYRRLLDFVLATAPATILVGLTATPWPKSATMTAHLRKRFPVRVADVATRDLVKTGVLATPRLHTVDTHEMVRLTPEEARQVAGRDVPSSVLRDLDRESRNRLIVSTWLSRQEQWGKTLVFACDIAHADRLGALFAAEGVPSVVLHSRSEDERADVLKRFREARGDSVLISVGMLLEGVDVPDARTAFLARPTSSRIVLRQMIGRVLRGVAGGGEGEAHIVDLRDRWTADVDVLSPVELVDLDPVVDDEGGERCLPPVMDEISGEPIPEDVLQRIARAYVDLNGGIPFVPTLSSTQLAGFYELGYLNVPVFTHAADRWTQVIDAELAGEGYLRPLEMFDDLPVPQPVASDVRAVVEFCRSEQVAPPLVKVRSVLSLGRIIQDLRDAGPLGEDERLKFLLGAYESTLARSAYGSFQVFFDAVQQELLRRSGVLDGTSNPESVNHRGTPADGLPFLRSRHDRELWPLVLRVAAQGREILRVDAPELDGLLHRDLLPPVEWSRFPVPGAWAYWHAKLHGKGKGKPVIRINCALQAPKSQVADELLEYLIWHELVHHVLPGRGHDGEFRRLESLWPDFARLDYELDTLDERFDLTRALARR